MILEKFREILNIFEIVSVLKIRANVGMVRRALLTGKTTNANIQDPKREREGRKFSDKSNKQLRSHRVYEINK